MRTPTIGKNKAEGDFIVVGNRETSDIAVGTPVVFVMDGTNDAFDVQLPASSTAAKASGFPAGIAGGQGLGTLKASAAGQVVQVYGFNTQVKVVQILTRAATSSVWQSLAGSSIGDGLSIDTVGNALAYWQAATVLTQGHIPFRLAQTIASATTQASTLTFANTAAGGASSDVNAYLTSLKSVFIRCM